MDQLISEDAFLELKYPISAVAAVTLNQMTYPSTNQDCISQFLINCILHFCFVQQDYYSLGSCHKIHYDLYC